MDQPVCVAASVIRIARHVSICGCLSPIVPMMLLRESTDLQV